MSGSDPLVPGYDLPPLHLQINVNPNFSLFFFWHLINFFNTKNILYYGIPD